MRSCRKLLIRGLDSVSNRQSSTMICFDGLNFSFRYENPVKFITYQVCDHWIKSLIFLKIFRDLQWQKDEKEPSVWFMVYRITFACYFLFVLAVSVITADEKGQLGFFWIFVSNWNLVLNAVTSVCSVFILCPYFTDQIVQGQNLMPCVFQFYWFLVMLSPSLSFGITSVYWTFFDIRQTGPSELFTNAGNSLVLLIDLFINAYPARFEHFVYPMAVHISYFFGFNLPYTLLGGVNGDNENYVYYFVDWINKPIEGLVNSVKFIAAVVLMHILAVMLIKIRSRCFHKS